MNCRKAQSYILDSLYGELSPWKRGALDRHLAACANCSSELAAHKATIATFRKMETEEPSSEVTERIVSRAAAELDRRVAALPAVRRHWRPAVAAAAVAALVIVSFVYYFPLTAREKASDNMIAMKQAQRPEHLEEERESPGVATSAEAGSSKSMTEGDFADLSRYREAAPPTAPHDADREGAKEGANEAKRAFEPAAPAAPAKIEMPDETVGGAVREGGAGSSTPSEASDATSKMQYVRRMELSAEESRDVVAAAPTVKKGAEDVEKPIASAAPPQEAPLGTVELREEQSVAIAGGRLAERVRGKDKQVINELTWADAYFDKREFEYAAERYERALTLEPSAERAGEAMYKLGRSYQELDRCDKAVSTYSALVEKYPEFPQMPDVLLAAGDCSLKLGRTQEAIKHYELVRDKFPDFRETAEQRIEAARKKILNH